MEREEIEKTGDKPCVTTSEEEQLAKMYSLHIYIVVTLLYCFNKENKVIDKNKYINNLGNALYEQYRYSMPPLVCYAYMKKVVQHNLVQSINPNVDNKEATRKYNEIGKIFQRIYAQIKSSSNFNRSDRKIFWNFVKQDEQLTNIINNIPESEITFLKDWNLIKNEQNVENIPINNNNIVNIFINADEKQILSVLNKYTKKNNKTTQNVIDNKKTIDTKDDKEKQKEQDSIDEFDELKNINLREMPELVAQKQLDKNTDTTHNFSIPQNKNIDIDKQKTGEKNNILSKKRNRDKDKTEYEDEEGNKTEEKKPIDETKEIHLKHGSAFKKMNQQPIQMQTLFPPFPPFPPIFPPIMHTFNPNINNGQKNTNMHTINNIPMPKINFPLFYRQNNTNMHTINNIPMPKINFPMFFGQNNTNTHTINPNMNNGQNNINFGFGNIRPFGGRNITQNNKPKQNTANINMKDKNNGADKGNNF